jgi:hypothetical protein
MTNSRQNVTLIDDLPELDEIEKKNELIMPHDMNEKMKKFIRNNGYLTPNESGMQLNKSSNINIGYNDPNNPNNPFQPYNPNFQRNHPNNLQFNRQIPQLPYNPYNPYNPYKIHPNIREKYDQVQDRRYYGSNRQVRDARMEDRRNKENEKNLILLEKQKIENEYNNQDIDLENQNIDEENTNTNINLSGVIQNPNNPFYNEFDDYYNVNEGYEFYEKPKLRSSDLSCVNVADHASQCQVCSKLYQNDKTVYIVAIVILTIICIILLKRILEI